MRSSAAAMVAPVLPAEIMALARPSRTASAARTSVESFLRRTPCAGSSCIPMTSDASMRSSVTSIGTGTARRGRHGPTSTTGIPEAAARALRRGLGRGRRRRPSRRRRREACACPLEWISRRRRRRGRGTSRTTRTRRVGRLGIATTWAEAARRGVQLPGAGTTAAGLRLRCLLLGNGHRSLFRWGVDRRPVRDRGSTRGHRAASGLHHVIGRRVHRHRRSRTPDSVSSSTNPSSAAQRSSVTVVSHSRTAVVLRSTPQLGTARRSRREQTVRRRARAAPSREPSAPGRVGCSRSGTHRDRSARSGTARRRRRLPHRRSSRGSGDTRRPVGADGSDRRRCRRSAIRGAARRRGRRPGVVVDVERLAVRSSTSTSRTAPG